MAVLMIILAVVVAVVVGATYLTTVPCRLLAARRRRVGWSVALFAPVLLGLLSLLLIYQGTIFRPREWLTPSYMLGTTPIGVYMMCVFGIVVAVGLVPALFVVRCYRRRFTDVRDPA